jgi:hypothetical protein
MNESSAIFSGVAARSRRGVGAGNAYMNGPSVSSVGRTASVHRRWRGPVNGNAYMNGLSVNFASDECLGTGTPDAGSSNAITITDEICLCL